MSSKTLIARRFAQGKIAGLVSCVMFGLSFLNPSAVRAQQNAEAFFQQNCAACHTVGGGKLLGPDLKGVTKAREHEWLEKWIENPQAVIDSGDAYALKLKKEYNGIVMPAVPGMTPQVAESLLNFIAAKSGDASAAKPAAEAPAPPFTPEQAAAGKALFLGQQRLQAGGPACISCHAVKSAGGALGGGQLGPDLTLVYQRLNGRRGLEAWLKSPASATMKPIFTKQPLKPEEISALTAFFEQISKETAAENAGAYRVRFFLLGLSGAAFGLVMLGLVWKRRIRGVRRALVEGKLGV
ncbi:MAG TPA: c-type cytochrome [Terriglobia bacterium]|nr:c-type cytochrome [Terriglobia bacterium]